MDLKPINTQYDGCRFRSRLEARWAVLLNRLGASWQYEPEGFDLGDGLLYLPDFLVKNIWFKDLDGQMRDFWLEIKPEGFTDDDGLAERKARALVLMTGVPLILFAGQPENNGWAITGSDTAFGRGGKLIQKISEPLHEAFTNLASRFHRGEELTAKDQEPLETSAVVFAICGKCRMAWVSRWLSEGLCPACGSRADLKAHSMAVSAALSARFEFGEQRFR